MLPAKQEGEGKRGSAAFPVPVPSESSYPKKQPFFFFFFSGDICIIIFCKLLLILVRNEF